MVKLPDNIFYSKIEERNFISRKNLRIGILVLTETIKERINSVKLHLNLQ